MSDPLSGIQNTLNGATESTAAQDSIGKLSEDFDAFLLLLTTQLRNQDPLSPVDTTEFTNQLVQFASVEQLIKQNENLETLIRNQELDRNIAAAQYVGARVEHPTQVFDLIEGFGSFTYELPVEVSEAFVEIADSTGLVVRTFAGPTDATTHQVVWDGTDQNGAQLDDGLYQVRVRSTDLDGDIFFAQTRSFGTVTSVDTTGSQPVLTVFGDAVGLSDVSGITF